MFLPNRKKGVRITGEALESNVCTEPHHVSEKLHYTKSLRRNVNVNRRNVNTKWERGKERERLMATAIAITTTNVSISLLRFFFFTTRVSPYTDLYTDLY